MKNLKSIAFILIIFSLLIILIKNCNRSTGSKLSEKDMKIEKLISERDAIIELTKKYVKTLDELKNKIQQANVRIQEDNLQARLV